MKDSINIIGVGGSIHDYSSCLLQDGELKWCIEDERLVRKKHAFYEGASFELLRYNAANRCLDLAELREEDIDLVVANDILSTFYYKRLKSRVKQFVIMNHHLSHAYSTYIPSEFSEAAILTIDGGGTENQHKKGECYDLQVASFAYGEGKKVKVIEEQYGVRYGSEQFQHEIDPVTNSLGGFYGVITHACGFTFHQEGKTMGLASYGTNKYYQEMMKFVSFEEKGRFCFSFEGIEFLYQLKNLWLREKEPGTRFLIQADIAYAGQKIVELGILHAAEYLKECTQSDHLCIAGGVALNSVANYKLYKQKWFKNYFIQPAAGDNGTSIGAAYYGWHEIMKK